jgi:hypothetical protein
MKRLFSVVVLVLLSSCTTVEDFGAYWDQGYVDPALEGVWKKVGVKGRPLASTPGPEQLRFRREGESYSVQVTNPIDTTLPEEIAAQREKDGAAIVPGRTIRIGPRVFFMVRGDLGQLNGLLQPYEIKGDVLQEYILDGDRAANFVETKYPTAKNIRSNSGEGRYVVIKTFDDEVFRILAEMAADPAYWTLVCQYKKVS